MTELDALLAEWAAEQRLTDQQVATLRANVLAEGELRFDAEWFWSLLRPVTSLLDQPAGRALQRLEERGVLVPYLQLA
jgi:hypothetical protein